MSDFYLGLISGTSADGIDAAVIGEVAERGTGVEALRNGRRARWPRFAVDEIARLFAEK